MSHTATNLVRKTKTGSPSRKAVLLILADYADQWGYAWPGIELIAEESELGYRQVRRILQELVDGGFLGLYEPIKQGRGRHNLYTFGPDGVAPKAGPMPDDHQSLRDTFKPCRWARRSEIEKGDILSPFQDRENGDTGDTERGHLKQEKGSPMTPEPLGTRFEPSRARDPSARRDGDAHALEPTEAGKRPWEALSHARLVAAVAARRAERGSTVRMAGITEAERQAADAFIQAVERGEIEDKHGLTAPHACDVWRRHEHRIKAMETAEGKSAWGPWLSQLTPHADDGETLTLAAPTRFIAGLIERDYADGLGNILDRKIAVEVRIYAGPAAHERQHREAAGAGGS